MVNLKQSCLSYNWIVSLPPASIFNKKFKYEAKVDDAVVSFISSSLDFMELTSE
jgi:hypothetical protein